MTQTLKKMDEQPVALPNVDSQAGGLLGIIARASADPTISVDRMERLYALYKEEKADNSRREFNEAMAAAQAEMPVILKTATNPSTNSKYAKLEKICETIAPVIERHKFSLKFGEGISPNPAKIRVMCVVSMGGHSEEYHLDLSPDDMGMKGSATKTKIHGEGSTLSYGRRYLTMMIFNLTVAGEDDDGNQGQRARVVVEPMEQPKVVTTTEADEKKALVADLWNIVKPFAASSPKWNPKSWDLHNEILWRFEVLDGAVPETAPNLSVERLKKAIAKAKEVLK